jgi:hypothetical protein
MEMPCAVRYLAARQDVRPGWDFGVRIDGLITRVGGNMVENEGVSGEARAREDEYFRRRDRELIEKMRAAAAADEAREALGARSGLQDPALLQEFEALGFTPDTVSLLPLVPIVQVAWAEGHVTDAERELIVQLARQRGIDPGSPADTQLSAWLATQPSEDVFARATRLIRAVLDSPASGGAAFTADDLLRQCEEIAAASGGVMGFRKISAQERTLLQQIEKQLKSR